MRNNLFIDDRTVPDHIRRSLKKYESGQRLLSFTSLPGWEDVLDVLKEDIQKAEGAEDSYEGNDPTELFRLHTELQGKRKMLKQLESEVKARTALASDPPPELQRYIPF